MKTSIKLTAVAILLFSNVFAKGRKSFYHNTITRDSIYFEVIGNNRGVKIGVGKNQSDLTIITILDADRKIILSEKYWKGLITAKGYVFPDEGTYYFIVESDHLKVEKKVIAASVTQQIISLN